jgi:hypothetical protein
MARAIVRYSFNGPTATSSPKRTLIRNFLRDSGFVRVGTASWEITEEPLPALMEKLQSVMTELKDLPEGGKLDHLWIYIDESS